MDRYLEFGHGGAAESSLESTRAALKLLVTETERRPNANLADIYLETIRWMHQHLAPKTYVRRRTRVRSFLNWCVHMGYIDRNPALLVRAPAARVVCTRPPALTSEDYKRLLKAADELDNPFAKEAIITGFWTGMSIGDSCILNWRAVDLDAMVIRTIRLKSTAEHIMAPVIPIIAGSEFHKYLLAMAVSRYDPNWPNEPENNLFFVNPMLTAAYIKTRRKSPLLFHWMRKVFNKAGLPRHRFHDLRVAMATTLANDPEMPLGTILKIMGWSDPKMVSVYNIPGETVLHEPFIKAMMRRDATLSSVRDRRVIQNAGLCPPEHTPDQIDPVPERTDPDFIRRLAGEPGGEEDG